MIKIDYNENVTLGYEHEIVQGSANLITGAKYFTKVYLVTAFGRYLLGNEDGRLTEDEVKMIFGETIRAEHGRQYGTQSSMLRKNLRPARDRQANFNPRMSRSMQVLANADITKL